MIFFKKKYLHNSLKNSIFAEQSMYTQPASQPASQPNVYLRAKYKRISYKKQANSGLIVCSWLFCVVM